MRGKTGRGILLIVLGAVLLCWGCATVGKDFSSTGVSKIEIGETTKQDIRQWFGPPWRVGVEDAHETWTYGLYHYRVFGETETKDLVIRFDENGRVMSYTYNTTNPEKGI
ncbi:MAG: outer membrane protein assembly factor BamE [Thermodesulfobacteriota bacterium]|nr:outer membrane protein assembly factor BamE [Thermodesulfobacteriota bacterium]